MVFNEMIISQKSRTSRMIFISVRCILAMIVLNSLQTFRSAIRHKYGPQTAFWHLIITTCQFHIMFYASRPLPNIFALAVTMYAMAHWLKGESGRFIMTSAFAILVFRGELALLLGLFLLMDLIAAKAKLLPTIGKILYFFKKLPEIN